MCGALKRARLVKVGVAEVVFVRKEDAVSAYRKYNNRCLDGECQWQGHICGSSFCFTCRTVAGSFQVKNITISVQKMCFCWKVTEIRGSMYACM